MRPSLPRPVRCRLFVALLALGWWIAAAWSTAGAGQEAKQEIKPPALGESDLGTAVAAAKAKIGEGRIDDALALISEKAAKHPEWPPPHLIMARLLFAANHTPQARRALEQAARLAPDHPEVYLMLGGLAIAEGRLSDARLNYERVLALAGSGRWDAERARAYRVEGLASLAAIAESWEDWTGVEARVNTWLQLDPKNGQARQRLGGALFKLGKEEDAFASLKQAVKDAPALEPAAVSMALLYGSKGDIKKAEEWFEYARKVDPQNPRVPIAHAKWLLAQGHAADAAKRDRQCIEAGLHFQGSPTAQCRGRLERPRLRRRREDSRAIISRYSGRFEFGQPAGLGPDRAGGRRQAKAAACSSLR